MQNFVFIKDDIGTSRYACEKPETTLSVLLFTGVPSQPSNLRASEIGETEVTLQWSKPTHSGESIVSYELYWNDTYARQKYHRRTGITESYKLTGLYPNTLYYIWLAARSQRGEGATTPPIPVRTKQYGKMWAGFDYE